jgi:D-alanyl-D-alanine dipeptidase
MNEVEDKEPSGGRANLIALAANNRSAPISFNRQELNEILEVYGRKVADGEWRDYAIDQMRERAVFSVFRRSSEVPLYRIVKQPRQARRQGAYSVVAAGGLIVKRGHDLARVLRVLDPQLRVVA